MNIQDIEESIVQLEESTTTFDNAFKLASLYILRDNLKPGLKPMVNNVEGELNDILPQYRHYIEVRRNFQLGKTTEKEMLKVLSYLCQEIKEFLQALYASTASPQEQELLNNLYSSLLK